MGVEPLIFDVEESRSPDCVVKVLVVLVFEGAAWDTIGRAAVVAVACEGVDPLSTGRVVDFGIAGLAHGSTSGSVRESRRNCLDFEGEEDAVNLVEGGGVGTLTCGVVLSLTFVALRLSK